MNKELYDKIDALSYEAEKTDPYVAVVLHTLCANMLISTEDLFADYSKKWALQMVKGIENLPKIIREERFFNN